MTPEISIISLCGALFLLLLPQVLWAASGNLTQNSSRECAICHFRWMDQFVAGHGTELAPLETEDVAGKEMMCLSCHDGSTDDSRTKIWLRDRHRTGMVPSGNVTIPKVFPLSKEGTMVCATCHSAHSIPTDTSIEGTIFLRVSSKDSQMCEMCHTSQHDKAHINHPLHKGQSRIPGEILEAGGILSTTNKNYLICESCHTAHGGVEHRNLLFPARDSSLCGVCHETLHTDMVQVPKVRTSHPIKTPLKLPGEGTRLPEKMYLGSADKIQCLSCHFIHEGERGSVATLGKQKEHQVKKILRFDAADSALCIQCHSEKQNGAADSMAANHPLHVKIGNPEKITKKEVLGWPEVQCLSCHQVHKKSERPGASRALVLGKGALCSACHQDQRFVAGTDHDMSVTAPESTNRIGQSVAESDLCGSCHIPHNGVGAFLWGGPVQGSGGSSSSYCLGCHTASGPAAAKVVGNVSHPVDVALRSQISLPLFPGGDGVMTLGCPTCHEPHQWSPVNKRKGSGKNMEGSGKDSFLRKQAGDSPDLCESCHPGKFSIRGTDHDMAITSPGTTNVEGLNVREGGVCSSCHVVHNGTAKPLWARRIESKGNSNHQLCQSCHRKGGPAEKKTTGLHSHPVEVAVSAADLPLIENLQGGTEMGCSTCHDPHTWAPGMGEAGSAANMEGTEATSFLRKQNNEQPLLCKSCHPNQALVKGSDHDLWSESAKNSGNNKTKSGQSVCNPCHLVHNSPVETLLWNGPVAEVGQDFMEKICNGCHSANQPGQTKIITSGSHPRRLYFGYRASYRELVSQDNQKTDSIPLYDISGRKSDAGEISCPTCHDPHIWSATGGHQEVDDNREGTVVDSFLRSGARNEICYACHGPTTLLLYRFYHDARAKQQIRGKTLSRKAVAGGDGARSSSAEGGPP